MPQRPATRARRSLTLGVVMLGLLIRGPLGVTASAAETAPSEASVSNSGTPVIVPDPVEITSLPGYVAERIPAPVLGGEVYVVEAGPEDAPTLVLVHGVTRVGAHDWYAVLPELAKQYRVLTFDLPGFHRSSGGNKLYSPAAYAEFVLEVAAKRRPGPFLLIGHSLGAAVSIEIAARGSDRVQRLMLVDVAGILLPKAFYYGAIDRANAKLGSFAPIFDGLRDGARDLGGFVPDAYAKAGEATLLGSEWLRGFLLADDPSRVAAAALMAHDFGPALGRVKAPTLVLWGELDTTAPLRTARAVSSRVDNAPVVILSGVKHVPMNEAPERFNDVALAWLSGTGPDAEGLEPGPGEDISDHDVECRSQRDLTFEGHYRRITLNQCRDIVLRNVYASQVSMQGSIVKIESSVIENPGVAVSAVSSELTISGGHIRGAIAIESSGSELDLAGTTLEGSEAALFAREGSTSLLCSICRLESPERQIFLHDVLEVLPGTRY
jgi:pimeloyl-ACP methyl ester carboxylesterase